MTSVSVHAQDASIMMTYYGTANDAARAKTMEPLNAKVSQTFPKSIIAEAYTSDMVVRALRKRGIEKYTVGEAFANLRQVKTPVLVVNVQLLDGVMTDKLQADISSTGVSADSIRYTSPLLYNSDDFKKTQNEDNIISEVKSEVVGQNVAKKKTIEKEKNCFQCC